MADGLIITDTSYAGDFAPYFILPATFGMDTVNKGVVYVKDGIKKKHTIGRINYQNPWQARTATPASNGASSFTIDARVLNPVDQMVYTEFNPRDFEQHWLAEQLSPTLLAREVPKTASNFMIQIALNRAMEQVETELWMGSTTYTAQPGTAGNGQICFFDGLLKKMVNDAAVVQVTAGSGTGQTTYVGTLTAAATSAGFTNIGDALNALKSLVATNKKALLGSKRYERMKFIVSVNTEQIYQQWLTTTLTYKGINTTEKGINKFEGYDIVPVAGMADNTIVFCESVPDTSSNLWFGMNSVLDENLQMQRLQNNSELFFLKALTKFDVNYGFSDEVFLFTTLTAATFNA